MSVRSAQSVTVLFTTRVFATGVATNADSLPTGTLYVNGTANGATVTVTNVTTGLYKAAVTLPTLAVGDIVDLRISATVSSVADNAVVWRDTKDVLLDGSGQTTDSLQTGDSYARLGAAGAGLTALGDARLANLDATVSSRSTFAGGAVASVTGAVGSVTGAVTVGTNNDKTGYALSATGLDSVPTTAPAGVATTFREMLVQTWRRFFKKATKSATNIETYADNGTTVLTTQAVSASGSDETQGAAT